ncbi:phosphotransferase KptA/Tpt1, partial [Sporodiniella umbellata]
VVLSKRLSYILRHGAKKENLNMSSDGFVLLDDVLKLSQFKGVTYPEIEYVVKNNDKRRYELVERENFFYIRATQGHSLKTVKADELLVRLESVSTPIVHGTTMKAWSLIRTKGLSKMGRNHIHFACDRTAESGIRKTSKVFIYIDFEKATKDGVVFYKSSNNVILSDGIDGVILPTYFLKVTD